MTIFVILKDHIETGGKKGIYLESTFQEFCIQFFFKGCCRLSLEVIVQSFGFFINMHLTFFYVVFQRLNTHIDTS
jgi:hypothetical protein